jgi:hypothetical protein
MLKIRVGVSFCLVMTIAGVVGCDGSAEGDVVDVDDLYEDFDGTWRTLVNDRPELSYPVIETEGSAEREAIVAGICVFAPDAGGRVPSVELSWIDTAAPERFDLTVAYQGFERRRFTTAFPVEEGERFLLPADSAYFDDEALIQATGPGIFPRIVRWSRTPLVEVPGAEIHTLVVQQLPEAISVTIRDSVLDGERWVAYGPYSLLTPICPD